MYLVFFRHSYYVTVLFEVIEHKLHIKYYNNFQTLRISTAIQWDDFKIFAFALSSSFLDFQYTIFFRNVMATMKVSYKKENKSVFCYGLVIHQ